MMHVREGSAMESPESPQEHEGKRDQQLVLRSELEADLCVAR